MTQGGTTLDAMSSLTIDEAKALVRIPYLWTRHQLPGCPGKSCRCPFHEDRANSCSVFDDGRAWKCFAGCGGGDAIDFLAYVCRLDRKRACRTFLEIAGGRSPAPHQFIRFKSETARPRSKPTFPEFEIGTRAELEILATLRGIGLEGLQWASERGVLRFATLHGNRAWIVTDGERLNGQARRIDGQCWKHFDGAKAYTLPGSWASWPLGIWEAAEFPAIALCEGGPDFLSAHHIALWEQASHWSKRDARCAPVAMLGASQRIHVDALHLFAGKRIRIFCHADVAGQKAARIWADQLASVNISADAFNFGGLECANGNPAKDLNDSLYLNADGFRQTERILP